MQQGMSSFGPRDIYATINERVETLLGLLSIRRRYLVALKTRLSDDTYAAECSRRAEEFATIRAAFAALSTEDLHEYVGAAQRERAGNWFSAVLIGAGLALALLLGALSAALTSAPMAGGAFLGIAVATAGIHIRFTPASAYGGLARYFAQERASSAR